MKDSVTLFSHKKNLISNILICVALQVLCSLYFPDWCEFQIEMFNVKFAILSWWANNYFILTLSISPLSFCQTPCIWIYLCHSHRLGAKINILNLQNVTLHTFLQHSTCGSLCPGPGPIWSGDFKPQPLPSRSLAQTRDKWRKLSRLPDIF